MTTQNCDICGEKIHAGRPGGRLEIVGAGANTDIDACGICLAATPGLQTDALLEDLRAAARRRKEGAHA